MPTEWQLDGQGSFWIKYWLTFMMRGQKIRQLLSTDIEECKTDSASPQLSVKNK